MDSQDDKSIVRGAHLLRKTRELLFSLKIPFPRSERSLRHRSRCYTVSLSFGVTVEVPSNLRLGGLAETSSDSVMVQSNAGTSEGQPLFRTRLQFGMNAIGFRNGFDEDSGVGSCPFEMSGVVEQMLRTVRTMTQIVIVDDQRSGAGGSGFCSKAEVGSSGVAVGRVQAMFIGKRGT